jgi:dephospho-CoA kinase
VLRVGLTGGIGCGKSVAVDFFRQHGVSIIDADAIAAKLVQPGQPALEEIAQTLGYQYLQDDGSLNRSLLKQEVFNNPQLLIQLESILHPQIRYSIVQKMDYIAEKSNPESPHYLIADIPLLIEKRYQDLFDEIIVVDCMPDQQVQRVINRDQIDVDMVKKIIDKQASRKERLEIATKTLDNSRSIGALEVQIEALHQQFNQFQLDTKC